MTVSVGEEKAGLCGWCHCGSLFDHMLQESLAEEREKIITSIVTCGSVDPDVSPKRPVNAYKVPRSQKCMNRFSVFSPQTLYEYTLHLAL